MLGAGGKQHNFTAKICCFVSYFNDMKTKSSKAAVVILILIVDLAMDFPAWHITYYVVV